MLISVIALTMFLGAQVPSGVGQGWIGEFDHASRQLLALAEATPAEKFAWRPGPGVRSIGEVYMHIALGNHFLLGHAGLKSPVDLSKLPKDPEKSITEKAEVIKFLKQSQDAVRENYPKAELQKKVTLFKNETTVEGVLLRILVHNHEHMGQAVAYARMNGIAPPWSAGGSQ
jgi:uncharacterized damage-inducible protein DinB